MDVFTVAPPERPRFNTASFAPAFTVPTPPPVTERPDKPRPRARGGASAGRAAASAAVCAACAAGVNAAVFGVALPWADAKLGGSVPSADASLPLTAAHDTVQAILAGAGTMLFSLYAVYAVGLTAYAIQRLVTRGAPVTWHRCDGADPSCCGNKPQQAYLSNGRGFETENARAMAGHLRWRKGCSRAAPLIIRLAPKEEPLW